jgi:hypothetical protein
VPETHSTFIGSGVAATAQAGIAINEAEIRCFTMRDILWAASLVNDEPKSPLLVPHRYNGDDRKQIPCSPAQFPLW